MGGRHRQAPWRNPSAWDAGVLGALVEWGYQPSEVERILLGEEQQPTTDDDAEANRLLGSPDLIARMYCCDLGD